MERTVNKTTKIFDSNRRYQDCRFIEKLYRRLKYQPICIVKAVFYTIKSIFTKNNDPVLVWQILSTEWQWNAKWMYNLEVVWDELDLMEGIDVYDEEI